MSLPPIQVPSTLPIKERDTLSGRETKTRVGIIPPATALLGHGHGGEITIAQVVTLGSQKTEVESCF